MNRYIGKYRVCCEWDRRNLEPIKEDTYVQCSGNGQIYRVSDNLLAYYKPKRGNSEQFSKKLIERGVRSVDNHSSDRDMLIYFAEDSLDIVANMVNASIAGADIKPWSVKNLRKLEWFKKKKQFYIDLGYYKELSEEEKEILRQRLASNIK